MSLHLETILSQHFTEFTPVLEHLNALDYIVIDLSTRSKLIKNVDISNPLSMDLCITTFLTENTKKVAYGGYLEKRNLYDRSNYFNVDSKRNIHLGIDLWSPAGTDVKVPLNGKIHSFANNLNFGDYGPTIILEHELEGELFFTLYGHLSTDSLKDLEVGKKYLKGETVAKLGNSEENGNYAPHLHFQIIKDLESYSGDYPGVSDEKSINFYKNNCPDPNLILGLE